MEKSQFIFEVSCMEVTVQHWALTEVQQCEHPSLSEKNSIVPISRTVAEKNGHFNQSVRDNTKILIYSSVYTDLCSALNT